MRSDDTQSHRAAAEVPDKLAYSIEGAEPGVESNLERPTQPLVPESQFECPLSMPPQNTDVSQKHQKLLKAVGIILLVLSLLQIATGATAFSFLNTFKYLYGTAYGAWWGSVFCAAAGAVAIRSKNVGMVLVVLILSCISIPSAVIGAIWDGFASGLFNGFKSCLAQPNVAHGGALCIGDPVTCIKMKNICGLTKHLTAGLYDDVSFSDAGRCYCSDGINCFNFQLTSAIRKLPDIGCQDLLSTYRGLITTSAAAGAACSVLALLLAMSSCTVLFCSEKSSAPLTARNIQD
jgi:hypothetical protein